MNPMHANETAASLPADDSGFVLVTIVFIVTYVALAIGWIPGLRIDRAGIALVGAAAMLAIGGIEFNDAMTKTDWSTIIMLMGPT